MAPVFVLFSFSLSLVWPTNLCVHADIFIFSTSTLPFYHSQDQIWKIQPNRILECIDKKYFSKIHSLHGVNSNLYSGYQLSLPYIHFLHLWSNKQKCLFFKALNNEIRFFIAFGLLEISPRHIHRSFFHQVYSIRTVSIWTSYL